MAEQRHRTVWNPEDIGVVGAWGEATASLDWCESNYQWTRYIAELFNTFSNVAFVALAVVGIRYDIQEKLPKRFAIAHGGLIVIGLGSALFHSTLLYSWQLLDELPMIMVSTVYTWIVFDLSPIHTFRPTDAILPASLLLFNVLFIYGYLNYPNPVFHQVSYGCLVAATSLRAIWILYFRPISVGEEKNNSATRKLNAWGSFYFLLGFFIWNCDNLLCTHLVRLKKQVGVPFSFFLEGHAYWHLFTGVGVYFILAALQLITLSIRDSPDHYEVNWAGGFLPWVGRTDKGWTALGQIPPNERTKLVD